MEFEPITFNLIEAKKRVVVGLGVIRVAELDRQIDGIAACVNPSVNCDFKIGTKSHAQTSS